MKALKSLKIKGLSFSGLLIYESKDLLKGLADFSAKDFSIVGWRSMDRQSSGHTRCPFSCHGVYGSPAALSLNRRK